MDEFERISIGLAKDVQIVTAKLAIAEARIEFLEKKQEKLDNYGWFALGIISLFTLLALGLDKFIEKVGGLLIK
jgi:hypothetical protein